MDYEQIVELIKSLCFLHPEIKGFYTGVESQHDNSTIEYPAVRIVSPSSIVPSDDENKPTLLKMKITVRVNKAVVTVGAQKMEVNLNHLTENVVINEINADIALENTLRNKAFRLAVHLVKWLRLEEPKQDYLSVSKVLIKGIDRASADYTTGANIFIDFLIGNPYSCEAEDLYEIHVNT